MPNKIVMWYKKQRITIKGAIIGGLFALVASIIPLSAKLIPDNSINTVMVITPNLYRAKCICPAE
jgi:hypothetical protein